MKEVLGWILIALGVALVLLGIKKGADEKTAQTESLPPPDHPIWGIIGKGGAFIGPGIVLILIGLELTGNSVWG